MVNREVKKREALVARALRQAKRLRRTRAIEVKGTDTMYVDIHPYPFIGHQVSSWISGYLWAEQLGLAYAGGHLSHDDRGLFNFEAFQPGAVAATFQRRATTYLLPVHSELSSDALEILAAQISTARRRNPHKDRVYRLSLDQSRWDQTLASDAIRTAVVQGYLGDELIAREERSDYIAVHLRRGDISEKANSNRWIGEEWYVPLIRSLRRIPELSGLKVRIYALGTQSEFLMLSREPGVELWLNGNRDSDFVDLCAARLLVAAPSSFSFTAALASRGPVLVRVPWWHRVPDEGRWIKMGEAGTFDLLRLREAYAAARRTWQQ